MAPAAEWRAPLAAGRIRHAGRDAPDATSQSLGDRVAPCPLARRGAPRPRPRVPGSLSSPAQRHVPRQMARPLRRSSPRRWESHQEERPRMMAAAARTGRAAGGPSGVRLQSREWRAAPRRRAARLVATPTARQAANRPAPAQSSCCHRGVAWTRHRASPSRRQRRLQLPQRQQLPRTARHGRRRARGPARVRDPRAARMCSASSALPGDLRPPAARAAGPRGRR